MHHNLAVCLKHTRLTVKRQDCAEKLQLRRTSLSVSMSKECFMNLNNTGTSHMSTLESATFGLRPKSGYPDGIICFHHLDYTCS